MAGRTIPKVLEETARVHGDAPALRQPRAGGFVTYSWNDYLQAAGEIAAGLRSLGIQKGEVAALDSETRLEFYLADLGILRNGSIAAALYPSYPAADQGRTLRGACARAVFVENPKLLEPLRAGYTQSGEQSLVRHWILLTGEAEGALTLDQLREQGRTAIAQDAGLLSRLDAELRPEDPAILYLTSGATGEPKMALVSHQAVVANIDMAPTVLNLTPEDSSIAFLPSAHIAQRIVLEFLPIRCGMPVTFSESLLKLPHEIKALQPTLLLAPPRMWERIYASICTELRKRPAPLRKAFYAAIGLALAAARYRRSGQPVPVTLRVPLSLANRFLFSQIRSRFGGRVRIAASGAAPLGKDLAEFYEAVGMPLIEGYGLTEGGVATLNPLDAPMPGSIGKTLPGVKVKLSGENELLLRSPCLFSGYWNDAEATVEVLQDGWLHTGDLAHIDSNGYIYITGRKKELIVSSTGKKIFPSRVEELFKTDPLISQVLLIGDRLPFLTALFTVNTTVAQTLKGMNGENRTPAEIAQAAPVLKELQKIVSRVNKQLAPFEQVRKYRVLPREFTIEQGELTATMKLRRTRAMANFQSEIEEFYAGRESAE